jgi:hypothetical protein
LDEAGDTERERVAFRLNLLAARELFQQLRNQEQPNPSRQTDDRII